MNLAQDQTVDLAICSLTEIDMANLSNTDKKRLKQIAAALNNLRKYTPRLQDGDPYSPACIPIGEAHVGAKWLASFYAPEFPDSPPMVVTFQEPGYKVIDRVARLRELYAAMHPKMEVDDVCVRQAKVVVPRTKKARK